MGETPVSEAEVRAAPEWTPIVHPDQLGDLRLRLMLAHWSAAATRLGQPPPREFVDGAQLGELMGWLFLYRVERDPLRFLYVHCGEKIARRLGFSLTGRYVHEHPNPAAAAGIAATLTAAVEAKRPLRMESRRRVLGHDLKTEVVVSPLAARDGTIDHVLALQILDTEGVA